MKYYLAVDIGASSGRHIDTILKVAKIFNVPVDVITRYNLPPLKGEVVEPLAAKTEGLTPQSSALRETADDSSP